MRDTGCTSARLLAWPYGHSTLYDNITRDFAPMLVLPAAIVNKGAGIRLGVGSSFSTGFCRACSIDPKQTMRGSRMRLPLYV